MAARLANVYTKATPAARFSCDLHILTTDADTMVPSIRAEKGHALVGRYTLGLQAQAVLGGIPSGLSNGAHGLLSAPLSTAATSIAVDANAQATATGLGSGYFVIRKSTGHTGTVTAANFVIGTFNGVSGGAITDVEWLFVAPPSGSKVFESGTAAITFCASLGNGSIGHQYDYGPFDALVEIDGALLHVMGSDYYAARLWWVNSTGSDKRVEFVVNPANDAACDLVRDNIIAYEASLGASRKSDFIYLDNLSLWIYSSGTGLYAYDEFENGPALNNASLNRLLNWQSSFEALGYTLGANISAGGSRYTEAPVEVGINPTVDFLQPFAVLYGERVWVDPFTEDYIPGVGAVSGDDGVDWWFTTVFEEAYQDKAFIIHYSEHVGEEKMRAVWALAAMLSNPNVYLSGHRSVSGGQNVARPDALAYYGDPVEPSPRVIETIGNGLVWERSFRIGHANVRRRINTSSVDSTVNLIGARSHQFLRTGPHETGRLR